MQKQSTKIAIIGDDKLAKALILGLLKTGFSGNNIVVITQQCPFQVDICISSEIQKVASCEYIILTGEPKSSGGILQKLKTVSFEERKKYEIISFIHDLSRSVIKKYIRTVNCSVVRAICNTNVAFGKGIICATDSSALFLELGKCAIEQPHRLLRSIVTIESTNAFDCVALRLAYESAPTIKTLHGWLIGLRTYLNNVRLAYSVSGEYAYVIEYLRYKRKIFLNDKFRYGSMSESRAVLTMQNTITALLEYGDDIKINHIIKLWESTITPDGCIEKGTSLISPLNNLLSFDHVEQAFMLAWQRAVFYKKEVKRSLCAVA